MSAAEQPAERLTRSLSRRGAPRRSAHRERPSSGTSARRRATPRRSGTIGVVRRSHATPLLTGRRPATRAPAGSSGIWRTAAPSRRPPCSAPSRRPGGMTRCVTARADSDGAAGTRNRVRTRRTSRRRSGPAGPRPPSNHSRCGLFAGSPRAPAARQAPQRGHRADAAGLSRRVPRWPPNWTRPHPSAAASLREGLDETLTVLRLGVPPTLARTLRSTDRIHDQYLSGPQYERRALAPRRCAGASPAWSKRANSSAASTATCTCGRSAPRLTGMSQPTISAPRATRHRDRRLKSRALTEGQRTSGSSYHVLKHGCHVASRGAIRGHGPQGAAC